MPIHLNTLASVRTEPSAMVGWNDYFAAIGNYNGLTAPAQSLSGQLSGLRKTLFSDIIDLQIIDILKPGGNDLYRCKSYEHGIGVESLLEAPESELPRVRIISLHSERSTLPLLITETLMRKVLTRCKVDPAFLHILFSFGDSPHLAESGSNNLTNTVTSDGSRNVAYQIRYIEENNRSADTPWSVRQTGVYHHHSKTQEFDLFILIHPLGGSVFEEKLLEIFRTGFSSVEASAIRENPYRLHVLPFALYSDNWRWYHRSKSDEFRNLNEKVITLDLKASDTVSLIFDKVQELNQSVYGMNLFVFNQTTNKIMIAQDFWIYIVTWIPLTALTFLLYGLVVLIHQEPGKSRWDWMRITDWNIKGVVRRVQDFTSTTSHNV